MTKPFRFKQFEVFQDQTAMKVGTDGILLGAWTRNHNFRKILDVGTGTGLLALMMAQKVKSAEITAIEIEQAAYEQAKVNFSNSSWKVNLNVVHTSLQDFKPKQPFDLIISNPPYYNHSYKIDDPKRALARITKELSYKDLLKFSSSFLHSDGICSFIIPIKFEDEFLSIAQNYNLFPSRITSVKGNLKANFKRSLIELSFKTKMIEESEIIIEESAGKYTDEYISLTKEFYLFM